MTVQDLNTLVGQNVRRYRELKRLTKRELAKKMGVSDPSITNIENGRQYPSGTMILLLAQALEVKVSQLYEAA